MSEYLGKDKWKTCCERVRCCSVFLFTVYLKGLEEGGRGDLIS